MNMTQVCWLRRVALAAGIAVVVTSVASGAEVELWYKQPARSWVEALPVGNGRLGAMVFGGVPTERLQLNEDTLWLGGPQDSDNPAALAALPKIRELLFAGKYGEAQHLTNHTQICKPGSDALFGSYSTLGELEIEFTDHDSPEDYRRELSLDDAIVRVSYRIGDAKYRRETFPTRCW
jgi:alpha-L-fucosidase 2